MSTSTSAPTHLPSVHPPASNPGHDNPTAGIPEHGGGLSSAAYIESPVQNHSTSTTTTHGETGIVASLKNMPGLGGAASTADNDTSLTNEPVRAEDKGPAEDATTATAVTATGTATAIATAVGTGTYLNYRDAQKDTSSSTAASNTTTLPDRSVGQSSGSTTSASTLDQSGPPPSAASHTDPVAPTADSLPDHTSTTNNTSSTNNPTTQDPPSSSSTNSLSPNPGGKQLLAASAAHPPPKSSSPAPHEAAEHGASGTKGPRTGNVENVDSIPTAGGERLGDKHWGESKIVPDDPKTQQGGAGVQDRSASAEVRENTAKNTGDATSGPQGHGHGGHDGGEKEGLMDKVKDKLNMGKK